MADYSHDLALLIHAFYVGELETGRRAASRLLKQDLPDDVDGQVRRNRIWYTPKLSELGAAELYRIDIKPAHPNWSLFNPTLFRHDNRLVGLVRSSNYKMEGMRYIIPPEDKSMIRTVSVFVEYNDDLSVKTSTPLADPDYDRTSFSVDGIEDCRLYAADNQLRVSGTVRNFAPHDGACRIGTATVDVSASRLTDLSVPHAPSTQHEKNWMPVVGRDCWLYSCNHNGNTMLAKLVGKQWQLFSLGPAPRLARTFRGGTQLVPFDRGYLCAIHEVTFVDNNRTYEHRFVWFDDQLRVRKVSEPFCFRKQRAIEFAAGMAIVGDNVVTSFGIQDKEAWLASMPRACVANLLQPV